MHALRAHRDTGGNYRLHSLADTGALRTVLLFEGEPIVISLEIHS